VPIICIERVIVAVVDLDAACTRWSKAGFAVASKRSSINGLALARLYAGAIEIDLVAPVIGGAEIPEPLVSTLERGGGILGWTWGVSDGLISAGADSLNLPIADDGSRAIPFAHFLPGVWTGNIVSDGEIITRRANLEKLCGPNENSVDYLEHIVVMTPSL
jgi:hypothetical protein